MTKFLAVQISDFSSRWLFSLIFQRFFLMNCLETLILTSNSLCFYTFVLKTRVSDKRRNIYFPSRFYLIYHWVFITFSPFLQIFLIVSFPQKNKSFELYFISVSSWQQNNFWVRKSCLFSPFLSSFLYFSWFLILPERIIYLCWYR